MTKIEEYERDGGQYSIPKRLNYLAFKYNFVSWQDSQKLYQLAVDTTLTIFNVEILSQIPLGQGYRYAAKQFEELLKETNDQRLKEKEKYEKALEFAQKVGSVFDSVFGALEEEKEDE